MPSAVPTPSRAIAAPRSAAPAPSPAATQDTAVLTEAERQVVEALRRTPFGTVEVVLHQHRIVQVVRSEKTRFD